ncbi:MAG: hypothetical protein ABSG18_24325 [Steroidobacteraceae bacterium]|jgi:hypothetical protein
MTLYTAHFRTDSEFATYEVEADTPELALIKAQELYASDPCDLRFESYDDGMPVNEIEIMDADRNEVAAWLDDDLRLRRAARDLLDALDDLVARERAEAAANGFTDDEMTWLEDARRAIAKAKGGAA